MLSIPLVGASVSEAPSCGLNGCAVTIYRRPYVHHYCACAALRANVAGQIGNRFSPAESAFSACIGSGSSQSSCVSIFGTVCDFSHARPIMLSIPLVTMYIYIDTYVHRYCACAALRANVAGQIGNRFNPAESAFSACIGSGSSQSS